MSAFALRVLTGLTGLDDSGTDRRPVEYTRREVVLRLAAGLAVTCALIHVGAAVDHYREFPLYTLVFSVLALAQLTWAALLVWRPTRLWLSLGCALQLGIVVLWIFSRTTGVPIAPTAWAPEQIGVADLVETVCELATVVAVAGVLLSGRSPRARRFADALPPFLLTAVLIGALLGTGAHAG
jgi:hypothetical protein